MDLVLGIRRHFKSHWLPRKNVYDAYESFNERNAFSGASESFLSFDPTGKILYANSSADELLGLPDPHIPQLHVANVLAPRFSLRFLKTLSSLDTLAGSRFAVKARHASGRVFPVEVVVFKFGANKFGAIFHDISARIQSQRELSEAKRKATLATKAKTEFLANMSHEIRTPLNAIIGMTDLLAETPLALDQEKYVRVCRKAGSSLLNIVNDVLDISKIEAGQIVIEREEFDLHEVLAGTFEVMSIRAGEKGLSLTSAIEQQTPRKLKSDPKRIKQIVSNLLANAIKFTDFGGVSVQVSWTDLDAAAGQLNIFVKDTGIGIAETQRSAIFEKFTQADASATRRRGGTGLGLAICRKLVDLMGGSIELLTSSQNGSEFKVTIPAMRGADQKPMASVSVRKEVPKATRSSLEGLKILLVEDSPDNRALVLAYLRDCPVKVEIAENGQEACEKFRLSRYDLILMDMQMPILDGYSATRQIRVSEAIDDRLKTPIVALTAHALNEEIKKCLDAGCDGHLAKPVRKAQLIDAIEMFAGRNDDARGSTIDKDFTVTDNLGRSSRSGSGRPDSFVPPEPSQRAR